MKVFSLLSLYGNLENFIEAGISNHSSPCLVHHAVPALSPYGCGVLFICFKVLQNLRTDKRIAPHFLYALNPVGAAGMLIDYMGTPVLIEPNDLELLYFYKNVILYYECEVNRYPKGFYISNRDFSAFMQRLGTVVLNVERSEVIVVPNSFKMGKDSFFIQKKFNNMSILASLLAHFRDSFAHGYYSKVKIDGVEYLCLEDYSKGNKLSMIAQIPLNQFVPFVELIKKIQKKEL